MRRALLVVSIVSCVLLLAAQLGSYLEFAMVPAPTAATTGPQSPADLIFGLMALAGGGLGLVSSLVTEIIALAVASRETQRSWLIAIAVAGALVLVGLAVSAFVLLGLPRNAYHPLTIAVLAPLTGLAYLRFTAKPASGT